MSTFLWDSVFYEKISYFFYSFIFSIYWILFDCFRVRSRWFPVSSTSDVIHIVVNNFEISFWTSTLVKTFLTEIWSEHQADMYRTFFIVVTSCTMSKLMSVMLLFAVRSDDLREKLIFFINLHDKRVDVKFSFHRTHWSRQMISSPGLYRERHAWSSLPFRSLFFTPAATGIPIFVILISTLSFFFWDSLTSDGIWTDNWSVSYDTTFLFTSLSCGTPLRHQYSSICCTLGSTTLYFTTSYEKT